MDALSYILFALLGIVLIVLLGYGAWLVIRNGGFRRDVPEDPVEPHLHASDFDTSHQH